MTQNWGNSLTKKRERQRLRRKQSNRCKYCRKTMSKKEATLDHRIPRVAGGPNARWNLVLCCDSCNKRKGSMSPDEWDAVVAEMHL